MVTIHPYFSSIKWSYRRLHYVSLKSVLLFLGMRDFLSRSVMLHPCLIFPFYARFMIILDFHDCNTTVMVVNSCYNWRLGYETQVIIAPGYFYQKRLLIFYFTQHFRWFIVNVLLQRAWQITIRSLPRVPMYWNFLFIYVFIRHLRNMETKC